MKSNPRKNSSKTINSRKICKFRVSFSQDFNLIRISNRNDLEYSEEMGKFYDKMKPYCHPAWTMESEFIVRQKKELSEKSKSVFDDNWFVFELVALGFTILVICCFVVNTLIPNVILFKVFKYVAFTTLILLWLRLYKTLRFLLIISEIEGLLGMNSYCFTQ